jgi:hypothetical protein
MIRFKKKKTYTQKKRKKKGTLTFKKRGRGGRGGGILRIPSIFVLN